MAQMPSKKKIHSEGVLPGVLACFVLYSVYAVVTAHEEPVKRHNMQHLCAGHVVCMHYICSKDSQYVLVGKSQVLKHCGNDVPDDKFFHPSICHFQSHVTSCFCNEESVHNQQEHLVCHRHTIQEGHVCLCW